MRKALVVLFLGWFAGSWSVQAGTAEPSVVDKPLTARQIITRNLEAVGGIDRISSVSSMALHGASGSALLPPSEKVTLYLAAPDRLKQVGAFRIILCDGEDCVVNNGETTKPITGRSAEGLEYRLGFYHRCFSLLAWREHFDAAELVGLKRYGPTRQYEIRLPKAESGSDLMVYVDAETYLVDRLVYTVSQEGAGVLKVVNQLRDWTTVDGIMMPMRIVFDTIGWETTPTHFVVDEIEINPKLPQGLFEDAVINFGSLSVEPGVVRGEVFGDMDGMILVNIREQDLEKAGIEVKGWVDLRVGEDIELEVRYLSNIQRSAADIKPDEIYLTTYPISLYPRMMLLGWEKDLAETIPCSKGDSVVVTARPAAPAIKKEGS